MGSLITNNQVLLKIKIKNVENLSKEEPFGLKPLVSQTYEQLTPPIETNCWVIQGNSPLTG